MKRIDPCGENFGTDFDPEPFVTGTKMSSFFWSPGTAGDGKVIVCAWSIVVEVDGATVELEDETQDDKNSEDPNSTTPTKRGRRTIGSIFRDVMCQQLPV